MKIDAIPTIWVPWGTNESHACQGNVPGLIAVR